MSSTTTRRQGGRTTESKLRWTGHHAEMQEMVRLWQLNFIEGSASEVSRRLAAHHEQTPLQPNALPASPDWGSHPCSFPCDAGLDWSWGNILRAI